jgi:hypothetical protein
MSDPFFKRGDVVVVTEYEMESKVIMNPVGLTGFVLDVELCEDGWGYHVCLPISHNKKKPHMPWLFFDDELALLDLESV